MYNGCFKNLDTPEKTYWFGFIVGDGNIYMGKKKAYTFTLALKDKEHVEKFTLFLGYPIERISIMKNGCHRIQVGCKELVMDLMKLGLTPKKALIVDENILPQYFQFDFVRGLLESDGCIYMSKKHSDGVISPIVTFYGNYPLLKAIKNVINETGNLKENRSVNGHTDMLRYGGRLQVDRILRKIYCNPPYLDRKHALYKIITDYSDKYNVKTKIFKPSKYPFLKNGYGCYEKICLYCGEKFLARAIACDNGKGNFCSISHVNLYRYNGKKEVGNFATC